MLLRLFQEQFDAASSATGICARKSRTALEYQRRIEMQIRRQQDRRCCATGWRTRPTRSRSGSATSTSWRCAWTRTAPTTCWRRERADAAGQELKDLRTKRQRAANPDVQRQLDQVIDAKRKQWQTLSQLDDRMKQAELQMKQSLTALATIYSQVQLVDAQSVQSGRAERLQSDIQDQVVG